jgi:hypothetical protein
LVIGAGKAAASMALAVERHWPAGASLEGVVITRHGHGLPTERIAVIEAGHPVPDEAGEAGAREILRKVMSLGPDDLLLALISGGGSALLSLPAEGVGMEALKGTTRELLKSGARIEEINTVRKHLSAIQGGRLASASKAPVLALVISDVTGDDPTHIASGPCAPDPTTYGDALSVLERYGVSTPLSVLQRLKRGASGEIPTPKPTASGGIATARLALGAAEDFFHRTDSNEESRRPDHRRSQGGGGHAGRLAPDRGELPVAPSRAANARRPSAPGRRKRQAEFPALSRSSLMACRRFRRSPAILTVFIGRQRQEASAARFAIPRREARMTPRNSSRQRRLRIFSALGISSKPGRRAPTSTTPAILIS